jgi:hypothetical protein
MSEEVSQHCSYCHDILRIVSNCSSPILTHIDTNSNSIMTTNIRSFGGPRRQARATYAVLPVNPNNRVFPPIFVAIMYILAPITIPGANVLPSPFSPSAVLIVSESQKFHRPRHIRTTARSACLLPEEAFFSVPFALHPLSVVILTYNVP